MKINQFIIKIIFIGLITSCGNQKSQNEEFERLAIWEDIQIAIKENRTSFLLDIAKDTLDCVECNNGKSRISKTDFYSEHLNQIRQPKNKKYNFYTEEINIESESIKKHRINYSEEFKGNKYNTIYTIIEKENKIEFQGVFSVP